MSLRHANILDRLPLNGRHTFDCPACGGICNESSISVPPWQAADLAGQPVWHRVVAMCCEYCGHRESRDDYMEGRR